MVVLEAVRDCRGTAPVTLVLTVLNAAADLPGVLASIGGQRLPPAEVLIADRGSTDDTLRLLAAWSPPPGCTVRVINAAGVSTSVARNLAIEAAAWPHIAVTHGAVRLDGDWLARLWAALAAGGEVVAGLIRPVGDTLLERTIGLVQTPLPEQIDPARYDPPSTALAFTKTVWDGVGGYPEWLDAGQDRVFAVTLRQAGATTRLVPAAITWWSPRQTLPGYLTDRFRTAQGRGPGAGGHHGDPAQRGRLRGEPARGDRIPAVGNADRAGSGGGPPRPVRPPGMGHPGGHPGSIAHPAGNDVRRRPGRRMR